MAVNYGPAIQAEVDAAESDFQSAVAHAIKAGELLIEVKGKLKHGQWLPWLEANVTLSEREARNYMRLARNRRAVADLPSIRQAVAYLASPSTKPESPDTADTDSEGVDAFIKQWEREHPQPERQPTDGTRDGHIAEFMSLVAGITWHSDRQEAVALWLLRRWSAELANDPDPTLALFLTYCTASVRQARTERAWIEATDDDAVTFDERTAQASEAWSAWIDAKAALEAAFEADS
jgi:hypothetical protein